MSLVPLFMTSPTMRACSTNQFRFPLIKTSKWRSSLPFSAFPLLSQSFHCQNQTLVQRRTEMGEEEVKGGLVMRRHIYVYKRHHLFSFLIAFIFLLGVIALVVWLVYRPIKPSFSVFDATIYDLDARTPGVITTSMQFTVVSHHPSKRSTAYYDRLSAYMSFRDQVVTEAVQLPPMIQEEDGTVVISVVVGGGGGCGRGGFAGVVNGLATDEACGMVELRLVMLGRVKWKSGAFRSGYNSLYAACDVPVGVQNGQLGQVPLLGPTECKVDV